MNKRLLAPIIVTGLAISACGGPETISTPKTVQQAADDFIATYGCKVPEVPITMVDFRDMFPDKIGALGATTLKGVFVNTNSSLDVQQSVATHEAMHACTDVSSHTVFEKPFQLDPVTLATSSIGFRIILDGSTPDQGNDMQQVFVIEEGIVEWVSAATPNYRPSEDYSPLTQLTANIAKLRGLSREEIVDMHQNDDIIGFVALVYGIDREAVTDFEFSDLVFMYQGAFYERYVPTVEELDFQLNYGK